MELKIHNANKSKMERINKPIAVQHSIRKPVMTQYRKPQALPSLDVPISTYELEISERYHHPIREYI